MGLLKQFFQRKRFNEVFGPPDSDECIQAFLTLADGVRADHEESTDERLELLIETYPHSQLLRTYAVNYFMSRNLELRAYYHLMVGAMLYPRSPTVAKLLVALMGEADQKQVAPTILDRAWPQVKLLTNKPDKALFYAVPQRNPSPNQGSD